MTFTNSYFSFDFIFLLIFFLINSCVKVFPARSFCSMHMGCFSLVFSREPRLYKRVCPSVGPLFRWSVDRSVRNAFVTAGRDKPANDLFRVYELVLSLHLFVCCVLSVRPGTNFACA